MLCVTGRQRRAERQKGRRLVDILARLFYNCTAVRAKRRGSRQGGAMRDLQLPGPKKMATATLPPPPSLRAYLKGPPAVSMRTLAHKVGVHPSMISMLSSGKRKPGADVLDRLHK